MLTGVAPGVNISKATSVAKLASIVRKEDKAMKVGRAVKNSVKHGKGFNTGDARHVNSGQNRVKNNQVRLAYEQMQDASYNSQYAREYNALRVKEAKAKTPEQLKLIQKQMRDLAKRFIDEGWLH